MKRRSTRLALGLCVAVSLLQAVAAHEAPQMAQSPDAVRPLLIGAKVPPLTLKTTGGEPFDLNQAFSKQPTIVILYRGGW